MCDILIRNCTKQLLEMNCGLSLFKCLLSDCVVAFKIKIPVLISPLEKVFDTSTGHMHSLFMSPVVLPTFFILFPNKDFGQTFSFVTLLFLADVLYFILTLM